MTFKATVLVGPLLTIPRQNFQDYLKPRIGFVTGMVNSLN